MIQVNLFLMNPCKEYWGDLLTSREKRKIQENERHKKVREEDLHLEQGNALLTSMGMLGRDFFELIENYEVEQQNHFEEPAGESLISIIQDDILNLRDRSMAGNEKRRIAEADDSIQVHSCHSPMREVEALQDRLLSLFESLLAFCPRGAGVGPLLRPAGRDLQAALWPLEPRALALEPVAHAGAGAPVL